MAAIIAISMSNGLLHCLSPVLGEIQLHYPEVSVSMIQMLITISDLTAIAVALITGWLAMRISQKRLFMFAAFVAAVSGFLPYLADSFGLLLMSRMLYGVDLGIVVSLITALVADYFEGDERVKAMGIQGASVGAGMVVVTTLSGIIGSYGFQHVYMLHGLAFITLIIVAICLPDEIKTDEQKKEKIRLNRYVYVMAAFVFVESFFVIVFSTNISMHLAGALKGSTSVAGAVTGVFSASQIVMGLALGRVEKYTRKFTLPVAMLSMAAGYLILVLFPDKLVMLIIGATLAGFSQGMYFPKAMVEVSTVVPPSSTAMASGVMTVSLCGAQLISPVVVNLLTGMVFGSVTTTHVYLFSCICIAIASAAAAIWKAMGQAKKE